MYCPSVRAVDVEINVDETQLTVHVNPYFLRLNFPHSVAEDDSSSADYDPSTGYLSVTLTKEQKGQHFKDLDLLAKLLAPRQSKPPPSIEVISSAENGQELSEKLDDLSLTDKQQSEFEEAAANDWRLPQQVPEGLPELQLSVEKPYGFLDLHSGYFRHVAHTENEVNDLGSDAEMCSRDERTRRRIKREDEKWDPEHYMADFADDEYIRDLLTWTHPHIAQSGAFEYTESENLEILRLPRKESKGRNTVMRCLLDMKRILDHHEVYYVYSKIWVDDFCVWVQAHASDEDLASLGKAMMDLKIKKDLIEWHLEELEAATQEDLERESDSDDESASDLERAGPL
ncbi:hypothetical protein EST38_g7889 [Candolleomyces aberdarensis]|uniref:CS domain-containing protein n=1 Tax=Candolleomyces aberdarensis TaxID=2316362 RepID=A0A4Q2DE36_9AGAR|nr:hypothetical protein EST38_g7889 [Candolleomyces aberdarensis]